MQNTRLYIIVSTLALDYQILVLDFIKDLYYFILCLFIFYQQKYQTH